MLATLQTDNPHTRDASCSSSAAMQSAFSLGADALPTPPATMPTPPNQLPAHIDASAAKKRKRTDDESVGAVQIDAFNSGEIQRFADALRTELAGERVPAAAGSCRPFEQSTCHPFVHRVHTGRHATHLAAASRAEPFMWAHEWSSLAAGKRPRCRVRTYTRSQSATLGLAGFYELFRERRC